LVRINAQLFTVEKRCPKVWANYVIIIKLAEVNNRPKIEDSPNLVTLFASTTFLQRRKEQNREQGDLTSL
jgi:hypothetical protein